jgi:hypothetical protein
MRQPMGKRQRRRLREQSTAKRYWYKPGPKCVAEDEATTRLRRLVDQRRVIEREIDAEVDRLVGQGLNWPRIARALGVTRQAARQRYGGAGARPRKSKPSARTHEMIDQ